MPFGQEARTPGVALALSGGGFRAVLFHLGVLWRLNELGVLARLARISSVSGGSITSGLLAIRWPRLQFGGDGYSAPFEAEVVAPLREFCGRNLDVASVLTGAFNPFRSAGEVVADEYRRRLGMDASLQSLPDEPHFVFNATNFATGVSLRFSKPCAGDYRIGLMAQPRFDVATAVACSSAFPPAHIADLAAIRTRLDRFKEQEQRELINWGYAVSNAVVRSRAPQLVRRPQAPAWPYPRQALH